MVWLAHLTRLICLVLPTIFPSWRFFKEVEASPRLQVRVGAGPWMPAVPRLARLGFWRALGRLFWNRDWNEYLFLVSCAERLIVEPTQHSVDEILVRLTRRHCCGAEHLCFRIQLAVREAGQITLHPVYESAAPHVLRPCPASD